MDEPQPDPAPGLGRLHAPLIEAASHLEVAEAAARVVRAAPLLLDERRSAAALGLCESARDWTPADGPFRAYAYRRCRWRILGEARAERRKQRFRGISGLAWTRSDVDLGGLLDGRSTAPDQVEADEEAARLIQAIRELPRPLRLLVDRVLAGESWTEAAAATGLRSPYYARDRTFTRLWAALVGHTSVGRADDLT